MQTNTNGYQYYCPPVNNQPYGQPFLLDPRFDMILQHIARLEQNQIAKAEQAALAEEAYSEITENAHQLWVADKRGIMHVLLEINFDHPPITLATPTKHFIGRIAERKDQPLLVRDSTGQKENAEILLHSMESGEIPLEVSKDVSCPALHSLPTVISDCVSILSSSPYFATIDVDRRDLAPCTEETLTALNRYITDYLRCFTEYVSTHIDELTMCVSCGIDDVTSAEIGEYEGLSEDGITTYGILLGIQQMISGFFHSLAPNKELEVRMHNLLFPSHFSIFRTALLNAVDSNCNVDNLASLFLSITNHMIDQNQFDARSIHDAKIDVPCNESKLGIVYADEFYICLTRHAFKAICTACDVSGPMMLKALSDAELLKGTRVNSETMQTRITVYDACGKTKVAQVYKFEREAIESNYS